MGIDEELEGFKKKYAQRLKSELGDGVAGKDKAPPGLDGLPSADSLKPERTGDYDEFKKQFLPRNMNWYEKACAFSEKTLKIAPDKKKVNEIKDNLEVCHLNVTPTGANSFAMIVPIAIVVTGLLFGYMLPYALSGGEFSSFFFVVFSLIAAVSVMPVLQKMPMTMAKNWRLKASNQMVLSIFYVVTYMRHTSNLELAIDFAAEHLGPPLSLDFKKIIWNIETGRFDSVKESLDDYLKQWRETNMEFVESMHLIESSLYESSEARRVDALEKSLAVMLDETYEKMLHFAHDLKGPLTTLHMMGVILPILGLVILPLAVSFMPEIKWYHIFMMYNVGIPSAVYYLGSNILSSRPSGYGQSDITEKNPSLRKYKKIIIKVDKKNEVAVNPASLALFVFALLFFIGISPLLLWFVGGECADFVMHTEGGVPIKSRCSVEDASSVQYALLDYREVTDENGRGTGRKMGPYGLGSSLLSLAIPLSFGFGVGLWNRFRSKNIIQIRERAKKLEKEFAGALFQLGNRLGDGYPAEIAFQKVASVMEGTVSGKFFELVSINISKSGMGVEKAIFDSRHGALVSYPSSLIESSMKVLVESSKKGPLIASQAVINVSEYIKQMHRVEERLRDLMADIISSMKSQISFLTPAIAGIVIGITSMIMQILGTLGTQLADLTGEGSSVGGAGGMGALPFDFGNGVPTYFFQVVVGLYVVQIVYILTTLVNGIQNGSDKLNERFMLGKNMIKSTVTYCTIAFIVMLIFSIIAGQIIQPGSLG